MTATTETTMTSKTSRNRKPAPRPERLAADAAIRDLAEGKTSTIVLRVAEEPVESKPVLDPATAERLAKEKAKLEREEKAAARRRDRIAALERGELPSSAKGLPPVVKMNELGAVARNLHRAAELFVSDEVAALIDGRTPIARTEAAEVAAALRDAAWRRWDAMYKERAAAGATDNDTLHPLGLSRDEDGNVRLVEKPKAK